jgi:trehalose-6-phosphatase
MGGWSVKVGRGATRAHYRLRDVAAVLQWLADLAQDDQASGTKFRSIQSR